jgi:outer membrane protein, heavy metal efflux system
VLLLRMAPAGRFAPAGGALVVLLLANASAAAAEVPGASGSRPPSAESAPPVEELVARALANAPSIAARRARVAAAQAAAKAADVLPDPMLEFEVKDGGFPKWTLGDDPMSMIGATIRQPLVSKGRKVSRLAAATAEIEVRQSETSAVAADLAAAVQTEYSRIYAVDRERAILRDSEELARLLAETATARYASGGSDQATVLRAQLERTRLAERAADLEAERTMLVVAMNRLLNQPPDTPLGEVRELREPQPRDASPAALAETAASQAPSVSARKADVIAATRKVEMLKEELHPTWTVGGSFFWQGGVDRVVSFTVGVDLPWRKDRNQQPLIAASERELEAARFELADTAAAMQAEAARLAVEIRRAEDQIDRYRAGLLPQSSAALDAARASYLGGRGDFASVLDEFRRWVEIRVELARREASRFAARAQLDTLVSKEPRS